MISSMTRQKIAITLPEEQVAAARQAVAEGRAASVSAFISQALARRDADEELAETIAEVYAQSGQPTEEDRLWARRCLALSRDRRDPRHRALIALSRVAHGWPCW